MYDLKGACTDWTSNVENYRPNSLILLILRRLRANQGPNSLAGNFCTFPEHCSPWPLASTKAGELLAYTATQTTLRPMVTTSSTLSSFWTGFSQPSMLRHLPTRVMATASTIQARWSAGTTTGINRKTTLSLAYQEALRPLPCLVRLRPSRGPRAPTARPCPLG